MANAEINQAEIREFQRIFNSRLDILSHLLDLAERHFPDTAPILQERLAPDMYPLGAQIVIACNHARAFAQWCADIPADKIPRELDSLQLARTHIRNTQAMLTEIAATDARLDQVKKVMLGPSRYADDISGRQYINDYLIANLYFHVTTAYDILRKLGLPLKKADFLIYLVPHFKPVNP